MPSKIKKRGENSYLLTVTSGYDGSGKQICHTKTVSANSPREAEKQYGLFLAEIEKGQIATSGKMTLTEYYDYWKENYATKNLASTTLATYEHIFKRIKLALGHKRIDKIEPIHLNAFFTNLQEPIKKTVSGESATLSTATIKKHYELLSIMFNRCIC